MSKEKESKDSKKVSMLQNAYKEAFLDSSVEYYQSKLSSEDSI
jgi:hypothetical protein